MNEQFNLSRWSLEHIPLIRYLMAALLIGGIMSFSNLGQDERGLQHRKPPDNSGLRFYYTYRTPTLAKISVFNRKTTRAKRNLCMIKLLKMT